MQISLHFLRTNLPAASAVAGKVCVRRLNTWRALGAAGFTLVELLVVMAIVAILASLAAPSFTGLIANSALDGHTSALMEDMRLARSVAVRRGRSVSMCPTSDAMATTPSCLSAANADWSKGWIIFEDTDANGSYSGTDVLVRRQVALENAGAFNTGTGNSTATTEKPPENVRYMADGRLGGGVSGAGAIILLAGNSDTTLSRAICVNSTGRVRATSKSTTTC